MSFVGLLTFSAVLDFILGIGLILAPVQFLALYNISLDAGGAALARLLGVFFLQMALVVWMARGFSPANTQPLATALSVGNAVGVLIALLNQILGGVGPMGWSNLLIFGFFAVAFGMFATSRSRNIA